MVTLAINHKNKHEGGIIHELSLGNTIHLVLQLRDDNIFRLQ